jgi:mannose-1-phosphate guanylyltransferase
MPDLIVPLIMCGGRGQPDGFARGPPKQFLQLFGLTSTFQETVRPGVASGSVRSSGHRRNEQYRFLVAEQLAGSARRPILCWSRPAATPPRDRCRRLLCSTARRRSVVLALAADHVVSEPAGFVAAYRTARRGARRAPHTFGVRPDRPREYGYICPGAAAGMVSL